MNSNPSQLIPVPPNFAVPMDLRPSRDIVHVSDIRNERLTQADARAHLTSYTTIRLEPVDCSNEIDEAGRPMRPSWDRANRVVLESDGSHQDAIREIRRLNKETKTVMEKRANLPTSIQIQIERAREWLTAMDADPQRFSYSLVQLRTKLDRSSSRESSRHKSHRKSSKHSSHSKRDKPRYDDSPRASVTLYFKRAPRSDVDSVRFLQDRQVAEAMHQQAVMHAQYQQAQMPFQQPFGGHQHQSAPNHHQAPRAIEAQPAGDRPPAQQMPAKQPPTKQPPAKLPPAQTNGNNNNNSNGNNNNSKPGQAAPVKIIKIEKTEAKSGAPKKEAPDHKAGAPKKETSKSPARPAKNTVAQRPAAVVVPHGKRGEQSYPDSGFSSRSSVGSNEPYWDEDEYSSQSSIDPNPVILKGGMGRAAGQKQRSGVPEQFGIATNKQHFKQEPGFFDPSPRKLPLEPQSRNPPPTLPRSSGAQSAQGIYPTVPRPTATGARQAPAPTLPAQPFRKPHMFTSSEDADSLDEDNYYNHEDDDYDEDERPMASRHRMAPNVVQPRNGKVRHVRPPEARERIFADSLDRLNKRADRLRLDDGPRERRPAPVFQDRGESYDRYEDDRYEDDRRNDRYKDDRHRDDHNGDDRNRDDRYRDNYRNDEDYQRFARKQSGLSDRFERRGASPERASVYPRRQVGVDYTRRPERGGEPEYRNPFQPRARRDSVSAQWM